MAGGKGDQYFTEATVTGTNGTNFHLREFVAPLEGGGAILTAQRLGPDG